MILSRTS